MTKTKAGEILGGFIKDWKLDSVKNFPEISIDEKEIILDVFFTADQLEVIGWWWMINN